MRRTIPHAAALIAIATLTLASCTSEQLLTEVPADRAGFFNQEPAPGFGAMTRSTPLARDEVVRVTIGAEGGRIDLPGAGAALVVPRGALSEETDITMRAIAGHVVAFEFAPHGLTFETPATISVRARGTEAEEVLTRPGRDELEGQTLERYLGVYYEGDPAHGVDALETFEIRLHGDALVYEIEHFSGYVSASG
ncbi:MAG: hypothetical protein AAF389_20810 [Gemmatimonadota bacterium]